MTCTYVPETQPTKDWYVTWYHPFCALSYGTTELSGICPRRFPELDGWSRRLTYPTLETTVSVPLVGIGVGVGVSVTVGVGVAVGVTTGVGVGVKDGVGVGLNVSPGVGVGVAPLLASGGVGVAVGVGVNDTPRPCPVSVRGLVTPRATQLHVRSLGTGASRMMVNPLVVTLVTAAWVPSARKLLSVAVGTTSEIVTIGGES